MDFRILGPLEAYNDGRPLTLGGARQRGLLAVLLLHRNEVVSSDRLVEALWGDRIPEDAGKALQVAVSRLRKALDPGEGKDGVVLTRAPGYELHLGSGQLDLDRFEELAGEGRSALEAGDPGRAAQTLSEALGLWRGPALGDLAYEAFAQGEIARLEELRLTASEDRVAAVLELGRHSEAIGELEQLVAAHPQRERIRAQLMLALYRSGRQAEALEQYRDARRALVDELGIEPGRELKELEAAILNQDGKLDYTPQPTRGAHAEAPASDELVGRERELAELVPLLDRTLSGNGGLALVGGEPGIGKSRLAEAVGARARERGARVLVGRCWEAGGAPSYWPWVQALRSYVRQSDPEAVRSQLLSGGAELATLVPELRELVPELPEPSEGESEGARFRLFESVAGFLRAAASSEPLTLVLDDLHAADEPSILLLRFVAADLTDAPVLLVGCYRDTEVGAGNPLAAALPDLMRVAAVRRISLKGLEPADTARLFELSTGGAAPAALAARIQDETGGNPLFAGEVARLLAAEGWLERDDRPDHRLPIPVGVKEAIGRRLQRHSDRCRQALTLASVLGREFDLEALERVGALDQDELFAVLEEAAGARLVGEVQGARGRLRFSHVLIRDALYEELPPTRRLRLHREIGEALEALYAERIDAHFSELAHHFLEAGSGSGQKALRYATRAGDRAASQLAYEEAARQYAGAFDLLERTALPDPDRGCELLLSLGDVLSRAGDGSGAKRAFERSAAIAEKSERPDQLARAALGYGGRFAWGRAGSDPGLVPLLERALAAVGDDDSPARVRLLARLAAALRDDPSRVRRLALAREAVDMARRIGDSVTLAYALDGGWTAIEGPDNVEERIGSADELIALAEQIGDKERAYVAHDYRLHHFWTLGDRAGVDVELDTLGRLADELGQPSQRWHLSASRTLMALMEGRFAEAEELIPRTLALGRGAQDWNAVVSQRLQLFVLRREQGRLAEIEETIARSVHDYPALLRFRCALAHLYAELGRERQLRTTLDDLLSGDLGNEYLDAEWAFGMSMLPAACAALSDAGAAERLYAWLLPYERQYAEAPVEAIFGSMARGLGVLATVLNRFDSAERHFEAALDVERRMRARPWLAHAQHDFAAMLAARGGPGDRERASELLAEAVGAYRELGMNVWADRAASLE